MKLPKEFLERMEKMLGAEYEAFLKSYEEPRKFGLRVNTAKISVEKFQELAPFHLTPIPWIPNGYFYPEDVRITADMLLLQNQISSLFHSF